MPKSTIAGHPLHPMLVVGPAALIPFGFALDAMHRSTGKESYANAAYYSLVGGLVTGLAAGAAGAVDYMSIKPETDVKRTANTHAMLNVGALVLTAVNVMNRRNTREHQGGSVALSAVAAAAVMISGWFGGRLVYEQGMRVEGVSPIDPTPELKAPGDEAMHHFFLGQEERVPASGPYMN
jgi:uncharacterized membrane protein